MASTDLINSILDFLFIKPDFSGFNFNKKNIMKIISKYKDYYDAGLIYGIDEKIYFKREQKKQQIELNFEWYIFWFKNDENVYEITIFPWIIWFCWDFFPLYIIDWEFTQSFIQNFWDKLPLDILDIIFNSLFKSEQIIWRTWLLSFDLDENWNFIYENWKFDYISLISDLTKLIEYFKLNETNITLENKDKILIITDNTELVSNQIFPKNKISYIQKNKLDSLNISEYTYILVHNNNYILSTDYLIKSIAYLQSGIWDLVSWKRVTNKSILNNKFSNFMFKWEDFKEYWKKLFKKQLTFVWTEYFPK